MTTREPADRRAPSHQTGERRKNQIESEFDRQEKREASTEARKHGSGRPRPGWLEIHPPGGSTAGMRPPERAGANKCEKKKKKKKKGGRGDDVEATLAERRRQNRCTFFLEQKNRYERTNEARHHRLPLPNYYFFF